VARLLIATAAAARRVRNGRAAALLAPLLLASCVGYSPGKGEAQLCQLGLPSRDTAVVSHTQPTGAVAAGDVDLAKWRELELDQVASARAKAKTPFYHGTRRTDCHNAEGNFWYPCIETIDVDLSAASGISRARDMRTAKYYAVIACEEATVRIASATLKRRALLASDLVCEVVEEDYCEIPAQ